MIHKFQVQFLKIIIIIHTVIFFFKNDMIAVSTASVIMQKSIAAFRKKITF